MRIELDLDCTEKVMHRREVANEVEDAAVRIGVRAENNLQSARATTPHVKIDGTGKQTEIDLEKAPDRPLDWLVYMKAGGKDPDAIAIEYGHFPSGVFAPERYGKVTKAPAGLYILTRAAGLDGSMSISSGRSRGKR
jgi:hypothetical protein